MRPRLWLSSPPPSYLRRRLRDRLMGVREPQQAQEPDEDNLAEERIAVDQEGNEHRKQRSP